VALAEGMLSVELAKVKDDWLWHNGMTGSMPEVEFGYFCRLGLENTEGRMGYIIGDEEPIAMSTSISGAVVGEEASIFYLSIDYTG
jgi:hypothetical protein